MSSRSRSKSPAKAKSRSRSRSGSRSKNKSASRSRSPRRRSPSRSRSPRRRSPSRSRSPPRRRSRSGSRRRSPRRGGVELEKSKIYIGNLNFRTDERDLRDLFDKFGRIQDVFIPLDRDGQARGFGFVTFEDSRDAEDAVEEMDDREIDGRRLRVNIARARQPLGSSRGSYGGSSYGGGSRGVEMCRDFQRGMCDRGRNCRFSHGSSRSRSRSRSRRRSRSR